MTLKTLFAIRRPITLLSLAAALAVMQPVLAAGEEEIGELEYQANCASCHGLDGKGDGPVAAHLTKKPYDLTQMSRRNDGNFPFLDAFDIIAGTKNVEGHGGRDMPVWGPRFRAEMEKRLRLGPPYPPETIDSIVNARILSLVYYLRTIQDVREY